MLQRKLVLLMVVIQDIEVLKENRTGLHMTYLSQIMFDHDYFISWLMNFGLIASEQACDICQFDMILVKTTDRSDGLKWECHRFLNSKRHKCQKLIRKDSFHEQRNMSLEEIIKFVY